jgi:hypothetical protein
VNAPFVARMEDVLELYAAPFDPARPVVCLDEYPLALTTPTRPDQPAGPGRVRRVDYEYARAGSCSLFAAFQPLAGWRTVAVHDRRTAEDFALFVRTLVDEHFPDAAMIRLVLDNLNTHSAASLYSAFGGEEARRLAERLEWHYTPVHGSWLNMIEIEWSVLAQQCLRGRRLGDTATVQREVNAWAHRRNAERATVRWHFTTRDARRALARCYPVPSTQRSTADPLLDAA